jgi:hypothetical protein
VSFDSTGHCSKDASGKITAMGDYCSQSNSAGGCADSFWLAATIAASAAKINDGSHDPACNGSGVITTDAGADGAGPADGAAPADGAVPADAGGSGDAGPG